MASRCYIGGANNTIAAHKYVRFIISGYRQHQTLLCEVIYETNCDDHSSLEILLSKFLSVHHCTIVTTWLVKHDTDKAVISDI